MLLIVVALFADVLTPYGYDKLNLADRLQGASTQYLLGTDQLGRDLLSRLIFGALISLVVGLAATTPEYGGTLTYPYNRVGEITDPFFNGIEAGWLIDGVNERLAYGNWRLDRKEYDFRDSYVPLFANTGNLAESWETPDPLTYIFHIRQGVRYALNPDSEASRLLNGRELTADDVVYTYQRNNSLGDFTERIEVPGAAHNLPWESIEATDKWTVVFKLKEPSLDALFLTLTESQDWILPAEVIEQYGDYKDWKNVVGTGPFILTDYVTGVSKSYIKNPDYWGFDEKYPQNRLPYIDQLRALLMADEATRISALRTGKVDMIAHGGVVDIKSLDVVRSLRKTNPEIEVGGFIQGSFQSFTLNIRKAPFDDIRVRHALQMALDIETINDTYYAGYAKLEPIGFSGAKGYYTPWEEWPEELKPYYRYDPQGAEKLLDEAGYPRGADGVRFKTTLQHRDVMDLGYVEIAVDYWAEIGVEVTINIHDMATLVANRTAAVEGSEPSYEMGSGNLSMITSPSWTISAYRATGGTKFFREWTGGAETPELTAAYDAFFAATTVEQQMKAHRAFGMVLMKQHNQIWGPLVPVYQATQAWVNGFNWEYAMGNMNHHTILARLWIDQELKDRTQ